MANIEYDYRFNIGPGVWGYQDAFDSLTGTSNVILDTPYYYSANFVTPIEGEIYDVGFYVTEVVPGSSPHPVYAISLRALDSNGRPSSTEFATSVGMSVGTDVFNVGWNWVRLTHPATALAGNFFSAFIQRAGGTITGSISLATGNYGYEGFPSSFINLPSFTRIGGRAFVAVRYGDYGGNLVVGLPV